MQFIDVSSERIPDATLKNINKKEISLINQALEHINENKDLLSKDRYIQIGFHLKYQIEEELKQESLDQNVRFIKFNDNLRVDTYTVLGGKNSILVQVSQLNPDEGNKRVASFQNGMLIGENVVNTDLQFLELDYDFTELSEGETKFDGEQVTVQGLPCIQDGCCSFRYNGLPWNPLVTYNWCGAGCGSGTPVNDLDYCCRNHDNCYSTYSSYPDRCRCDQLLLNCARSTDNAGGSRLISAFQIKMAPHC